ncbi:MAG: molecular chaperone DnaJ, partial [Candidatus Zixiibacteriota bacterium]
DYYNTLGVPENAPKDEIKKSFRALAKKYHPDRNKGDKGAESRFKEISEAYEVLSDDKKRQQYDVMRKYGAFGGAGGFDPRTAGTGGFDFSQFGKTFRAEDLGGFGPFADLFSSIFGGEDLFSRARGERKSRPRRGNDLAIRLSVSFDEAIAGAGKIIRMSKPVACGVCGGTGDEPGSRQKICRQCGGRGTVTFAQGAFSIARPCPKCLGKGVIPGKTCARCGGSGRVKEKKTIKVKIPAGVEDGSKIRLRGMGNPGTNGGPSGDLIITVNTGKHQQFQRKGSDIYSEVEISYPRAVLGTKIAVKTLTKTVNLNVPPGTKHGTLLRLKGMGLSVDGEQGHQFIEIHIGVPIDVTPEQKELLEKFERTLQ